MKVLFDHNVPKKLRTLLPGHSVSTSWEMGWDRLKNGDLLNAAEADGFAVIVTGDKNMSYQQNLKGHELALVVLPLTDWGIVRKNAGPVAQAVDAAKPGSFQVVTFEPRPGRPRGPSSNL